MHALLDVAEAMLSENMTPKQIASWNNSIYMPEPGELVAGFTEDEEEAAFAAFETAAKGLT